MFPASPPEVCDEIFEYLTERLPQAPSVLLRELADNWQYDSVDVDPADICSVLQFDGVKSYNLYSFDYDGTIDLIKLVKQTVPEEVINEHVFPRVFIVFKTGCMSNLKNSNFYQIINSMEAVFARKSLVAAAWYFGVDIDVDGRVQLIFPSSQDRIE